MDPLFQIVKRLIEFEVPFVVIGGIAARIHGSHLPTQDIDVCVPTDDATIDKLHAALMGINARFRFRPDRMRVPEDPARLHGIKNLNLVTDLGVIDLLGEVSGVGHYPDVKARSVPFEIYQLRIDVLDLDALIAAKTAAGRAKDKLGVMHLQAVKRKMSPPAGPSPAND